MNKRPTIGFLSTWSVFEGTAIDHYCHTLLRGICAAARDLDCNLLLGCGISLSGKPRESRTVWPTLGVGNDFVPIGSWNTDGLIIIPDDLSGEQFEYVQSLYQSGFPVILTTNEKPGPLVAVDNKNGIRQAFDHLWQHGHRRIAFIAGKSKRGGDSAERLLAYLEALKDYGIQEDARLIAYGEHRRQEGYLAMQQILSTGAPFTAVLASNDLSCLGALAALQEKRYRVPEDIALIGFDDILEARSCFPPLTTVRHPAFTLGYQAVVALLDLITGNPKDMLPFRIPTKLMIRQSCGCRKPQLLKSNNSPLVFQDLDTYNLSLARRMVDEVVVDARYTSVDEIEGICLNLIKACQASLKQNDLAPTNIPIKQFLQWLDKQYEGVHVWESIVEIMKEGLVPILPLVMPEFDPLFVDGLIDNIHLRIVEYLQGRITNSFVRHREMSNCLGLMTSQLLTTFNIEEGAEILERHLPELGIQHALVALYLPAQDTTYPNCSVVLKVGLPDYAYSQRFPATAFPPPGLYPQKSSHHLAILPLSIDSSTTGFMAFSASNLEPCAAIVQNLASALRAGYLYSDALEGRRVAEEANRLKSRFLSVVSHELRTPLSLIEGLSSLALQEHRDKAQGASSLMQYMEHIHESANQLKRLIDDVIDLASSEAQDFQVSFECLDLLEIIRGVDQIGAQLTKEKKLRWRAKYPPYSIFVLGDRVRLQQVILNLINNAIKFTPNGLIKLSVVEKGQHVIIQVSDTGIGIPASDLDWIFDDFYRSKRTFQLGYGGLGLGLSICKKLVEKHGGMIGVQSPGELGCGSTFYFTLPIIPVVQKAVDKLTPTQISDNRIIVITENSENGNYLCERLKERGFDATLVCIDPTKSWLQPLMENLPVAFILEQDIAFRHGWRLVEQLKRQAVTEHLPILIYSLDEYHCGEVLELNFLHKPLSNDELAQYLHPNTRLVMVIDDDPAVLDLHCRLVENLGCCSIKAQNGLEALLILQDIRPDLILLDLMMPEMDGFEFLDNLRSKEKTKDIPVIILTAYELNEQDIDRLNRRFTTIMSKGVFSSSEIIKKIEETLLKNRRLPNPTQSLIRRALGYIHQNFAEPITREKIAQFVNLNPDYFATCFRREMGLTPIEYLKRYRIKKAGELLTNSDLTITQIAYSVGFSSNAHFARLFKQEVGVSPREYRQRKIIHEMTGPQVQ